MLLLSIITLSTLFAFSNGLACFDNGDKEIGGSCYKFVSQQMTFNDARNWCHFQNPVTASYLAYVPNQFTGNFLASYARSAFGQNDGNFWIGLSRQNSSSPWLWDAGFPLVFTNFDGSQLGQNYAAESMVSTKWGTYGQDELKNFVCSYDPSAPPTFGPATALPETTARPIITTTAQNVPTTTDNSLCNLRTTKSTFLFAYSNDLPQEVVLKSKNVIVNAINSNHVRFVSFASVRYDNINGFKIYYNANVQDFSNSVMTHLPDPSQSFPGIDDETEIMQVLETFLNNTQSPLCGSFVVDITNRGPKMGSPFTNFPALLENKVMVSVVQADHEDGQYGIGPMEDVAGRSGGTYTWAGSFTENEESTFPQIVELIMTTPYSGSSLYSSYPGYIVNKTLTNMKLDPLTVPQTGSQYVNVTLAINSCEFMSRYNSYSGQYNLTLIDKATSAISILHYSYRDLYLDSDLIWKTIELKSNTEYDVYWDMKTRAGTWLSIMMYF